MNPAHWATVQSVLILQADRLYAELLRQQTMRAFPTARVSLASSVEAARRAISATAFDVFIAGADDSLDDDVVDLLAHCVEHHALATRILVVTTRRELRVLSALRALDIGGLFDAAHDEPENFAVALQSLVQGRRYWSTSLLQYFQRGGDATAFLHFLTAFEELVLSVIGNGCDDTTAALEFGVSPSTISTVRRDLHRKLGVQHRGELVRIAAQHGFVRFTPTGVVRPGFAMLLAAYQARRPRRGDAPLPSFRDVARPAA